MKNETNQTRANRFDCHCGATFDSEAEYRDHQKVHPQKSRAASVGAEQQPDTQRPREQGQTEEERREWLHTKDK